MSGIHKIPKRPGKINQDTQIVGGKKMREVGDEPKILDQRTRARPVKIETTDTEGDVVHVKSHTRPKPKGNS